MTPQELERLNKLEKKLDDFIVMYQRTHFIDRDVFNNKIVLNNNIEIGKNGTKIGTSTADKIAFFGGTPVDQPATVADPSGGATVDSQARTAIIAVIDRLQELDLIA